MDAFLPIILGGAAGAWTLLSLLSGERERLAPADPPPVQPAPALLPPPSPPPQAKALPAPARKKP